MNLPYITKEMEECIQNCTDCHNTCTRTAIHLIGAEADGRTAEPQHYRMLLDCAEMCATCADFMLRASEFHAYLCTVCAEICKKCQKLCAAGAATDSDEDTCASVCARCAESCARMSSALAA